MVVDFRDFDIWFRVSFYGSTGGNFDFDFRDLNDCETFSQLLKKSDPDCHIHISVEFDNDN